MNHQLLLFFTWTGLLFSAIGLIVFMTIAMRRKWKVEALAIEMKKYGTNTTAGRGMAALQHLHNDTRVYATISAMLCAISATIYGILIIYIQHA